MGDTELPSNKEKLAQEKPSFETVLSQAKEQVKEQLNMRLANPPSLYELMRIDQFAKRADPGSAQRKALRDLKVHFAYATDGPDGVTTRDDLTLRLNPYFGEGQSHGSYAERIPGDSGSFSPSVFMHEATHAAEYSGLLPDEAQQAIRTIIRDAQKEGRNPFMTPYAAVETIRPEGDLREALTTITERYADNPVRFVRDMEKPEHQDARKIASVLMQHHFLPEDALNRTSAEMKLRKRNRETMDPSLRSLLAEHLDLFISRDAKSFKEGRISLPYDLASKYSHERVADFKKLRMAIEQIKLQLKTVDGLKDAKTFSELCSKKDALQHEIWQLHHSCLTRAQNDTELYMRFFNSHPIEKNFGDLLRFFYQNGLIPNMSRTALNLLEKRESDVLAFDSSKLTSLLRNPLLAQFMVSLHTASGVEFALQDVMEIDRVVREHPELPKKLQDPMVQEKLFQLQAKGNFTNSRNNIQFFVSQILADDALKR